MSEQATILVVDDTPANLSILYDQLQSAGYRVLTAESGESALKRVSYITPDAILLDVMMPGIDGFETCRCMKQIDVLEDVPIIFMTALTETEDKVKGLESGAVDYITKPFRQDEVLARLKVHLNLRQAVKALAEQNAAKDNLIKELDAFAHTVAHDLRTPLNGVIGFTEILSYDWQSLPSEDVSEMLRNVHQSGLKLNNIISELLMLASVRQAEVPRVPIDLRSIAEEAIQRLRTLVEERKAQIFIEDNWQQAIGHAPWVEEIWANYISNAIKYGGTPPHLLIGCKRTEDGYIRSFVRDNGQGLSAEQQSKLFVPFTRLKRADGQGHGLGLSIVIRIVNKLGGRAGVESQPGHGSIFYFDLPEQPAH